MELKDYEDITVKEMQELLEGTEFEPDVSDNKPEVYNYYTQYVTQVEQDEDDLYKMPLEYLDAYYDAEEHYLGGEPFSVVKERIESDYSPEATSYALNTLKSLHEAYNSFEEDN